MVGLFRLLPLNPRLKCIAWRRYSFAIALFLALVALGSMAVRGFNTSIDYKGGTIIEVQSRTEKANSAELQDELTALETVDIRVKRFGDERQLIIELPDDGSEESGERQALTELVYETLVNSNYDIRRIETVEPEISQERLKNALIAVVVSFAVIFIYFFFRYGLAFALGGIVTTLLDIVLVAGVLSLTGIEFNLLSMAALLTVMGYSLNDTVVVYNRIRSMLKFNDEHLPVADVIERAIDNTFWRTVITSLAAFIAMAVLAFFAGDIVQGFAISIMAGIVIGTLSTPLIAAPLLLVFGLENSKAADRLPVQDNA